jgi:hypothetical protein
MSPFNLSFVPSRLMPRLNVLGEPLYSKTLKVQLILGLNLLFLAAFMQTKILSATDKKKAHSFSKNSRTKYVS